jgi:hypothetical protein
MVLAYSMRLLRQSLVLLLTLATAGVVHADPPAPPASPAPAPPPRLRLKNAQFIRVSLGSRRHEPALGIRPDKGVWNVVSASDLTGAGAELVDLTPDAPHSRWTVDVQGDKLVLDARRFVPTHVYQLDVRKEKRLIGTALIYLYPPPAEKIGHVEFKDEESTAKKDKDDSPGPSSVPKGDL